MDYLKENIEDIHIISVNLERASFLDAGNFQNILEFEIEQGGENLLVDLSKCRYIDSIFIGSIIASLRKLVAVEGNLKLVKPSITEINISSLNSLRIFDTYDSVSEALKSFNAESKPSPERFIPFERNSISNNYYSF